MGKDNLRSIEGKNQSGWWSNFWSRIFYSLGKLTSETFESQKIDTSAEDLLPALLAEIDQLLILDGAVFLNRLKKYQVLLDPHAEVINNLSKIDFIKGRLRSLKGTYSGKGFKI